MFIINNRKIFFTITGIIVVGHSQDFIEACLAFQ